MYLKVALLAAMVAVAASSPAAPRLGTGQVLTLSNAVQKLGKDAGNANNYIDLVLDNVNELLPARVDLPDFEAAFVNFNDCYMFGLDTGLERDGDATMLTIDSTVKFTAGIATKGTVGMTCRWKYLLMRGDAGGSTDVISISTGISLKLTSGSSPVLTEFRVTDLAPIETDISGLTPLFNWLAEDIADVILNNYSEMMIEVVETVVKDIMQDVLDEIVIP